jgi:uncharacterized caspase-like protein
MLKNTLHPRNLPHHAEFRRVVAVVVGIEDYQNTGNAPALPKVDFARNDAEGFAKALQSIYPADQLDLQLLIDSLATNSTLDYTLKQTIESLTPNDLFVFYYAGHGFHGAGGNRITAWDSRPFNIEGSTLSLREKLADRLAETECKRAIAFVDACATKFKPLVPVRDVLSEMDQNELKDFLASAEYNALFLSCKPGQKSYPSEEHAHGVWTYFLLRALRGDAEEALGPGRYLTAESLRDYLCKEVPRYVTKRLAVQGNQIPQAIIDTTNTFQIRHVPEPMIALAAAGDLSHVKLAPTGEYLEGTQGDRVRSLKAFDRKSHRVYPTVTDRTDAFVRGLLEPKIDEEIACLYRAAKETFELAARDLPHESSGGQGNLDCNFFRFTIESYQDPEDAQRYVVVRRLVLREDWEQHLKQIDKVFGRMFDKAVIEIGNDDLDFDDLVEFFEGVKRAHGGKLEDEHKARRITYTAADGVRVRIDLHSGRLSFSRGGGSNCSDLVGIVRQYRFSLSGPSCLLLACA